MGGVITDEKQCRDYDGDVLREGVFGHEEDGKPRQVEKNIPTGLRQMPHMHIDMPVMWVQSEACPGKLQKMAWHVMSIENCDAIERPATQAEFQPVKAD
ncbi:MAG: hypothetical protein VX733_06970 [Candidatus Latescibacterota bacterium]|nr:hypothetical protein [Candidatus Latescibacterota bacterium]